MAVLTHFLFLASDVASGLKSPGGIPWQVLLLNVFNFVKEYAPRIIVFTLLLKLLLAPFDIWQRYKGRKNQKIMSVLKDQMDKLKKQYATDRLGLQQQTRRLQKAHGYSIWPGCLYSIVSIVVFIWLSVSMTGIAQYQNMKEYLQWYDTYTNAYYRVVDGAPTIDIVDENGVIISVPNYVYDNDKNGQIDKSAEKEAAIEDGQKSVTEFYKNGHNSKFLWVKSIWNPDVPWKHPIMETDAFKTAAKNYMNKDKGYKYIIDPETGKQIDRDKFADIVDQYDTVVGDLIQSDVNGVNGYFILIIISGGLTFLSFFLMRKQQNFSATNMMPMPFGNNNTNVDPQLTMKIMTYMMPVVYVLFGLFQTAMFTVYMIVSSAITLLSSLVSMLIYKLLDKKLTHSLETNVKAYGRKDPNEILKELEKKDNNKESDIE